MATQKVFAAKLEGRDPAAEKREARRRVVADRVEDLLETFIAQRLSQNRSGGEIARLLRREVGKTWAGRSIHEISKRDVVEVVTAIEQRGAPVAANKTLKMTKTFLRWCVGRALLDQSPAEGVPLPSKEIARDRVLDDSELARAYARLSARVHEHSVERITLRCRTHNQFGADKMYGRDFMQSKQAPLYRPADGAIACPVQDQGFREESTVA